MGNNVISGDFTPEQLHDDIVDLARTIIDDTEKNAETTMSAHGKSVKITTNGNMSGLLASAAHLIFAIGKSTGVSPAAIANVVSASVGEIIKDEREGNLEQDELKINSSIDELTEGTDASLWD